MQHRQQNMENENEFELDLDNIEANAEQKVKVKNRFEKLSTDVILKSKERDDALAKVTTEAEARQNAEKERDFYKDFSTHASKYPGAHEYQTQIWEKRKAGYDMEDAMVAVLAKEGKLGNQPAPQVMQPQYQPQYQQAEGGSAQTMMQGSKQISDMSTTEKWEALQEAHKTGDLARALQGIKLG